MIVHPGVQFKSVIGNGLFAEGYFRQTGAHFRVELVPVHAEIGRGIPVTDETWKDDEVTRHGQKVARRYARILRGFPALLKGRKGQGAEVE